MKAIIVFVDDNDAEPVADRIAGYALDSNWRYEERWGREDTANAIADLVRLFGRKFSSMHVLDMRQRREVPKPE